MHILNKMSLISLFTDQSTEGIPTIKPDQDEQAEATSSGYISMKQGLEEQTMTSCTDEGYTLLKL